MEAFDELAARLGAGCQTFLYVPEGNDPQLERELEKMGYRRAALSGECSLSVDWSTFDDYLEARQSNRRHQIRREMARFRDSGYTIQIGGVEHLDLRLAGLQAQLHRKYGGLGDPARIEFGFRRAAEHLAPFIRPFIVLKNSDAVGFALFYQRDGELYCKQAGFDYSHERAYSYFNVVFYEPIRYAIGLGLHAIHYGSESYEAKIRRGCRLNLRTGHFAFRLGPLREDLWRLLDLHDLAQRRRLDLIVQRCSD